MTGPRTAAGWALRDRLLTALGIVRFYDEKIDAAILAIEAEAFELRSDHKYALPAEPAGAGLREALEAANRELLMDEMSDLSGDHLYTRRMAFIRSVRAALAATPVGED